MTKEKQRVMAGVESVRVEVKQSWGKDEEFGRDIKQKTVLRLLFYIKSASRG